MDKREKPSGLGEIMPIWKTKNYEENQEMVSVQNPKDWGREGWVAFLLFCNFDIEAITKFLADDKRFMY